MRLNGLLELTRVRILEFIREPEIIFWVFGFPVIMAVVLGMAFRSQPEPTIPVAVIAAVHPPRSPQGDAAGSAADQTVANLVEGGIDAFASTEEAAAEALRTGRVDLVIVVPESETGSFVYRFDPTRPTSRTARLVVDDVLQRAAGRRDAATVEDQESSEPGGRYIDFLMPGLIGLNLMGSSMWGLGFAVVYMRSQKLLKRIFATPMRRSDFLLSLMLSRLVFLTIEVAFLVTFGWLVFGVAVRGSLVGLAFVALLGSFSFTGVSLLIAARIRTIEAASGWMNLVMMPMWLCSGTFFSYARFPEVLHPVVRALPLTALNDALRAVINDGATVLATWPQLVVLVLWAAICYAVALRIFRWQ